MFANRHIWTIAFLWGCLLLSSSPVAAQPRKHASHFITASLAGGAGLGTSCQEMVKPGIGGGGQFALSYEILKNGFFCSLGVGAEYSALRYNLANGMMDAFHTVDRDNDEVYYRYVYSNYSEQQHSVQAIVPFWLGYRIQDRVYFALGVKASLPLWNRYSVRTNLYTEGMYPQMYEYVSKNSDYYAYYADTIYSCTGRYQSAKVYISPMAEVGVFFRIIPRVSCRIGAYVEYAIPVSGSNSTVGIVDYSKMDTNPHTRTKADMMQNIWFNSVVNSHMNAAETTYPNQDLLKGMPQYLSFGIRATFRFNVTHTPSICMCDWDI